MAPRVERIEQQIPAEWKEFAGKPMQISYYATKVNTFRENPDLLRPSDSFAAWATQELRRELGEYVVVTVFTLPFRQVLTLTRGDSTAGKADD